LCHDFLNDLLRWAEMKKLWLLCLLATPLFAAAPQATAPEGFEHWTPASLRQMSQTLGAKAAADPHNASSQQLSDFPNELFMLARRDADGQAEWHETQVDVFFVQSGSATLVVGGTLVGAQTVAPHEQRAASIQGGVRQKLSAGDVVRIPAKTPHQLLLEGAHEFNYFVIKVKGY
jgi:mannose-6-phosphate isomerase-like protein (cupin superfamily)